MSRYRARWHRFDSWMTSCLIGGLIGVVIMVGGELRARSDLLPGVEPSSGLGEAAAFGVIVGMVGGVVYRATRTLRLRGGWRFFLAWAIVGLVGMGAVAIPLLLVEFSFFWLMFWLLGGPGAGIGLALTEREIRR